jgi:hypothetical protein
MQFPLPLSLATRLGSRLLFLAELLEMRIVAQRPPERGKRAAELPGKPNALH